MNPSYLDNSFSIHCRQIKIVNIIVQLMCLSHTHVIDYNYNKHINGD